MEEILIKTIIAGSRDLNAFRDKEKVWLVADAVVKSGFEITEVICGLARGIDQAGKLWAETHNPEIPTRFFVPDWNRFGKAAGVMRNQDMADYGEALILIWNGWSLGSKDMLKRATKNNLKVYQYVVE